MKGGEPRRIPRKRSEQKNRGMNIIRVANVERKEESEGSKKPELGEGNTSDFYAFAAAPRISLNKTST
jgi:hypothetical protein